MFSNAPVICEEAEQVIFDGGSKLHLILWEKNIRWQDTGLKYISYVLSNFWSTSVVFDEYREDLTTTDNTHKCCLTCYFKTKKDAFLRNKHRAINVILTELEKPGSKAFHLYDDVDTDITELSVQSSLKCLITEISENKDLLV